MSKAIFVYLGFNVAFNTVQVISRRVVVRAEETSTYSSLGSKAMTTCFKHKYLSRDVIGS